MLKDFLMLYLSMNAIIAIIASLVSCYTNHLMCWTRYVYKEFEEANVINKIVIWITFIPSVLFEAPLAFICLIVLLIKINLKHLFD